MELVSNYMCDDTLRHALNDLTKKTFGFDFESWVTGGYHKCQLGFTPALKDMDICVAEQYDGADDYRLFYLGEHLKSIENEKLYFPELSHA